MPWGISHKPKAIMSTIFSTPYQDFSGNKGKITISTWPIIMSQSGDKILLHISSSTGKYQFIWGRLDDTYSFTANALMRAREVVWDTHITLLDTLHPLILLDTIERDGEEEKLLLIHYPAHIDDEEAIGEGKWFSLDEIEALEHQGQVSSKNILIGSRYFLNRK